MEEENKQFFAQKPKEGEPWDVAIIGSGPAGLTSAIYTTRGAASTVILGGAKWGGQLMLTTTVDNFPAHPGIQGPELMQKMRQHAASFGAEFIENDVTKVNFDKKPFEVFVGDKIYKARTLIIATGANTRWLGISGEKKLTGRGVSSCAPCDAPFFKKKNTIVVGGGDSAMEEALVLTKYATLVTIVHRRGEFRASVAMQEKVFEKEKQGKINILWDTEVVGMVGEQTLSSVKLKTKKDSEQATKLGDVKKLEEKEGYIFWEKPIDGIFVAVGHIPATKIFDDSLEKDKKGYIVAKDHIKTNIKGVFVAGDVHDYHYRQAITAAGFGCMAGMNVLKYLDKSTPGW